MYVIYIKKMNQSNFFKFILATFCCCFRTMYDSLDFNYSDCNSIAASTDEILWSDDDTIVADQETLWQDGKKHSHNVFSSSVKDLRKFLSPAESSVRFTPWPSYQLKVKINVIASPLRPSHLLSCARWELTKLTGTLWFWCTGIRKGKCQVKTEAINNQESEST